MAYSPMTRKERIAAGEAVTPVTRSEYLTKSLAAGQLLEFSVTDITEQGAFTVTTEEDFSAAHASVLAGNMKTARIDVADGLFILAPAIAYTNPEEGTKSLAFSVISSIDGTLKAYNMLWTAASVTLVGTAIAEAQ